MSDEQQGNPPSDGSSLPKETVDPIKNMHAEFSRKTEKLAQDNARLSQQLEQLLSVMQPKQTSSTPEDVDLEELIYKDPKTYAAKVKEQATKEATRVVSQQLAQQQQSNAILGQLVSDYPELNDGNSELTQRAIQLYKGLSEAERANPMSYKVAVRDAAAELGVLPKSKRKSSSDDDFSFGGSSSSSGSSAPKQSSKKEDVDNRTLAFAQLIGLNTNDKKVVERLKQRSQRKNWGKYE